MTDHDSLPADKRDHQIPRHSSRKTIAIIGVVLILLSGVLWFFLFAIPFLPLTIGQKTAIAGADFIAVQMAWWTGAALAGPELVAKLKSRFRNRKTRRERID